MKFHYGPWMGATVAYTAGVATACSLRGGKSDHKNHVVGGFAAGAVVGKFGMCLNLNCSCRLQYSKNE